MYSFVSKQVLFTKNQCFFFFNIYCGNIYFIDQLPNLEMLLEVCFKVRPTNFNDLCSAVYAECLVLKTSTHTTSKLTIL